MVAPDSLAEAERNTTKGEEGGATDGTARDRLYNGNQEDLHVGEVRRRQPSYVSLACCISGYTTLGYDSKTRQGRTLSPGRPIDPEPNRNAKAVTSDAGTRLSPLPEHLTPTDNMQTRDQGVEYLNGGGLRSTRHVASLSVANETRSYTTKSMFVSESFSSYGSVSSSTTSRYQSCDSPRHDAAAAAATSRPDGNESRLITPTKVGASDVAGTSPSSFIVQRVERLYGPGALAQGFYTRRMTTATTGTEEVSRREGEKAERSSELPVLRLLRPEFRAQLSLARRTCKSSPASASASASASPRTPREEESAEGERLRVAERNRANREEDGAKGEPKDGHYYLKRLEEEVRLLEGLAAGGEEDLKTCESEEGAGILRAAAGKARLLVAQKLHQFRGLCTNNLKQTTSESFPTTDEDLAGFWDMVMIQVRQVHDEFKQIRTLKANDWVQPEPCAEAGSKKSESAATGGGGRKAVNGAGRGRGGGGGGGGGGRKGGGGGGGEASRARDEARRRLIEEKRRAMRKSSALPSDNPHILLL